MKAAKYLLLAGALQMTVLGCEGPTASPIAVLTVSSHDDLEMPEASGEKIIAGLVLNGTTADVGLKASFYFFGHAGNIDIIPDVRVNEVMQNFDPGYLPIDGAEGAARYVELPWQKVVNQTCGITVSGTATFKAWMIQWGQPRDITTRFANVNPVRKSPDCPSPSMTFGSASVQLMPNQNGSWTGSMDAGTGATAASFNWITDDTPGAVYSSSLRSPSVPGLTMSFNSVGSHTIQLTGTNNFGKTTTISTSVSVIAEDMYVPATGGTGGNEILGGCSLEYQYDLYRWNTGIQSYMWIATVCIV